MAESLSAKEFKENCLESTNFWHAILAYLEKLEKTMLEESWRLGAHTEFPLSHSEQMFIARFLISSLKRIVCRDVHIIKEIIGNATAYYDLYYVKSDHRVQEIISASGSRRHIEDLFSSRSFDGIIIYKHEHVDRYFHSYYTIDVAIESANEDFTNSLMKYGWYSCGKMSMDIVLVQRAVKSFVSIWLRINGNMLNEKVYREASRSLVMEFLSYITQKHPEFPEKRPKKHIFFILKIIKGIILERDHDPTAHQYVNCVNLFYRIIPEPYVPHSDLRDALCFLLKHTDHKEEVIETYLTTYTNLFGVKPTTPYRPRTLKHLTRCAIRNEIIKKSNTLEMSVNHLHLPNYLKKLLLGEV